MKEFVEKLIGRLEEESYLVKPRGRSTTDYGDTVVDIGDAIDIVNQLAEEYINISTDTSSGWIPCSERLPEEPFGCLVTVMDCEPMTQTDFENILPYHVGYDGEAWNDADGNVIPFEVIAWQPLPAPYKEGE